MLGPLPPFLPNAIPEPELGSSGCKFKMPHTRRMRALERAALPHGRPGSYQVSLSEVEETKALLGLAPVFLCTCIWQVRDAPPLQSTPLAMLYEHPAPCLTSDTSPAAHTCYL